MLRRITRPIIAILLAVIGAACPVTGLIFANQPVAHAQPVAPAPAGSLEPIEREFITVIRFANLWEIPMGRLAAERGATQRVKEVGAIITEDHTQLDVAIKELAAKFRVPLPDRATSSQQAWMAEISSKSGEEFDRAFADRLRGAHGTVFGLVSEVRAGTRNEVIRAFAEQANTVVMKHMALLESTGLVQHEAMFAQASARTLDYPENSLDRSQIVLAIVLGFVALTGTLLAVRTLSSRGSAER
jgi:putative membrane protein